MFPEADPNQKEKRSECEFLYAAAKHYLSVAQECVVYVTYMCRFHDKARQPESHNLSNGKIANFHVPIIRLRSGRFFPKLRAQKRLNVPFIGKHIPVATHSTEHTLIAEPYVSALFSLARDAGAFDVVAQELGQIASMSALDATFRRMVADPTIPPATKASTVRNLLSGAKASDLTIRFVERVALNGRLAALPTMHRLFIAKLAEERGELHVHITSAKALSASQQKELSASLAKATGKTIVPNVTIDPSLIAGLVIHAGSRMLDYSLQGRLRQMALALQPSRFNRT